MKNITLTIFYFLIISSITAFKLPIQQYTISVQISGFESDKGKAYLMLLNNQERELAKEIIKISKNEASFTFIVDKKGYYAVKAFHDTNNNGKLDTNFLGIPKEKWGVSNNAKAILGPPEFKKMLFEVKSNMQIEIKLNSF